MPRIPHASSPLPVTAVIPFYNAQATFDEALDSIREQTDKPAEIFVIDDGSDTGARRFLEARRHRFELIRLPERRGPGAARNAGVAAASQPYVAFLDADDRWLPTKLRVQYRYMEGHPEVDVTYTGVVFSYENGDQRARVETRARLMDVPHALVDYQMATPSTMFRRSSFLRIGGYDPSFRCTQDWELQIRMALADYRVEFLPLPLTWVRRENHGHHSANWRCFLAGHIGILLKHRATYVAQFGRRAWVHFVAREFARAGQRQGGWLGRALRLPYRLGL